MKRMVLALVCIVGLFAAGTLLAGGAAKAPAAPAGDRSPAGPIAAAITTVTGIAISPLLGTGAYGAYLWLRAPDEAAREALPWFAQVSFWVPAMLIVGACAAKDAIGAAVPTGFKKSLDVLETLENKLSGLVAAGAVVPITVATLTDLAIGADVTQGGPGASTSGLAMLTFGAVDFSWLLNLLTVPFAVAAFLVVWMAAHAINVMILLSPWGAIDAALKVARTSVLGLLTITAAIDPWTGALLSLVIIVFAWCVAGWSFRLTTFGTVFCWDFFTRARRRFAPRLDANPMFAGAGFKGVPVRTFGRLTRAADGRVEFLYRPWLVLAPRRADVPGGPAALSIGRGFFFSDILHADGRTFFLLPPRYRGHEEELAKLQDFGGGVQPAGLMKTWGALRELFGTRTRRPSHAEVG